MKIEKTTCPYCGANLKIIPGQKNAECEYCGNSVLISGVEHTQYTQQTPRTSRVRRSTFINKTIAGQKMVKHAIFPPPGFRSRNVLHMLIAVCGYLFILYIAASVGGVLDFIFFTIASLSVIDICTDWTGIYAKLRGLQSENPTVRLVMKIIWSIVIFLIWIIVMVLLESFTGYE
ncbi:MAG: hypothetical protein J6D53_06915 [Blautia sp.]|nr:hypothetical protein [Blautia sp.]